MPTTSSPSIWTHLRISVVASLVLGVLLGGVYPLIVWGAAQLIFPTKANGSLVLRNGTVVGSLLIGQGFSDVKYFHPRPSAAGSGYDAANSGGSNLGPTSMKLILGSTKAAPAPAPGGSAPQGLTNAQPAQVVDADGIMLRVLHFCDDNHLPISAWRDGHPCDLKAFMVAGGWDEVGLITAFTNAEHPLQVTANTPIPADAVTASASGLDPHISKANALLQMPRVAKARGLTQAVVHALIDEATEGAEFMGILGDPGINVMRLNLLLDAHQ